MSLGLFVLLTAHTRAPFCVYWVSQLSAVALFCLMLLTFRKMLIGEDSADHFAIRVTPRL